MVSLGIFCWTPAPDLRCIVTNVERSTPLPGSLKSGRKRSLPRLYIWPHRQTLSASQYLVTHANAFCLDISGYTGKRFLPRYIWLHRQTLSASLINLATEENALFLSYISGHTGKRSLPRYIWPHRQTLSASLYLATQLNAFCLAIFGHTGKRFLPRYKLRIFCPSSTDQENM